MNKFKQVDELVFRGSHPITPGDFASLSMNNVKLIINLESGIWEYSKGDVNFEINKATYYGINVTHIHMSPIFPPTQQQLETVLKLIKMHTSKGEAVFFHCFSGVDRTGAVAAAYRCLVQKWSVVGAMEEMISEGHNWFLRWWDSKTTKNIIGLLKKENMI